MARKEPPPRTARARRSRKVTYSIPEPVVRELESRSSGSAKGKSLMVAEALAFYFAAQDRRALEAVFVEAAADPLFRADNEEIELDFATLDRDADPPR